MLLTTHYMEEADSLSDRLAIIDYGRVLALGSPEKLKATFGAHTIFDLKLKSREGLEPLAAKLKARPDVTSAEVTARRAARDRRQLRRPAAGSGAGRRAARPARPSHYRAQPGDRLHSTHREGPA